MSQAILKHLLTKSIADKVIIWLGFSYIDIFFENASQSLRQWVDLSISTFGDTKWKEIIQKINITDLDVD